MAIREPTSFRWRLLKPALIVIVCLSLGLAGSYAWFVTRAKKVLTEMVTERSAGKLKLQMAEVSFNFFSHNIGILDAGIVMADSAGSPLTYRVRCRKLVLQTNSFWSALLKRALTFERVALYDTDIDVFKWKHDSIVLSNNNISITQELGRLYNTIHDAISTIDVGSLRLNNARVRLINRMKPGSMPVVFSNIYFELNKGPGRAGNDLQVVLRSSDQDIALTDGIHQLLFRKLELQQAGNSIVMDSCFITALPSALSKSSYKIFFRKLALVNVNFEDLYKTNLIKADSAYCESPDFLINLNSASGNIIKKEKPDIEKIIRELSDNIDIGFVGVKNAGIRINITGEKTRSIRNSGKDNFQIQGFRVNPESSKPVSVKRFDMLVQGYQLYNADSSCSYSFDSIRFANNQLLLSNFAVLTASGANKVRNYRNYRMPYFELLGLNWYELIFRQNVKAKEAILHDPVIDLEILARRNAVKNANVFYSLNTLDDLMSIDRLKVMNGQFNIRWGVQNTLQLFGLNVSVSGNDFAKYADGLEFQRSVAFLFFARGFLKMGDMVATLQNVSSPANGPVHAAQLSVDSRARGIHSDMQDISVRRMHGEAGTGYLVIDGLEWKQGNIALSQSSHVKTNNKSIPLRLKNIAGIQTGFILVNGKAKMSSFIEKIGLASFAKGEGESFHAEGLNIKGSALELNSAVLHLQAASYVSSGNALEFSKVRFAQVKNGDSLRVHVPLVRFSADVNTIFKKELHVKDIALQSPVVEFYKFSNLPAHGGNGPVQAIKVDHIGLKEPDVHAVFLQNGDHVNISLPSSPGSEISAADVRISGSGVQAGSVGLKTATLAVMKGTKEVINIKNGAVDLNLSETGLPGPGVERSWRTLVRKLHLASPEGVTFTVNNNKVWVKDLAAGDLHLSPSNIRSIEQLVGSNDAAWIGTSSATYHSKNAVGHLFNVKYNAGRRVLTLDSLDHQPAASLDSTITNTPYQTDYITLKTGTATLSGFDAEKYFKKGILSFRNAGIAKPLISVYRDKLPPLRKGVVKPLPVVEIKNIALPVSIDSIAVEDGSVNYTEKHARTRKEGTLLLTRLNGYLSNIKNQGLATGDSLSLGVRGNLMDSVFFHLSIKESYTDSLSGFLMDLKINPASLVFLNPLLAPLSNVKIKSGMIDSLFLNAVGKEYVGYGEMRLYYHDLRIQLLKNGDPDRSTYMRRKASGLINTFLVKASNQGKSGVVYFKRLRDRSFFNYIVKMTFSGIATSVGARRNSTYRRAYQNLREDN